MKYIDAEFLVNIFLEKNRTFGSCNHNLIFEVLT